MTTQHDQDVADLRAFNRTYTRRLGLLDASYDGSPFTLSEARVLYELATRTDPVAAEIVRALGLDPAQVSRTLKRFTERGLVVARESPSHGRHLLLSLTDEGRTAFATLEANTKASVGTLIDGLHPLRRAQLLAAARDINVVFDSDAPPVATLRGLAPGDLGMVTARQGFLYADEYGWGADHEALIAEIVAGFHRTFDAARDDAWIAEADGRMVGSIFLVRGETPDAAKLRLLYVEPDARGMGVGQMLIEACVARARALGYRRLDLWTVKTLSAARKLYQRAGFEVIEETPCRRFGQDLIDQIWSLDLSA
ncbi:bifunctional helix-turn-helix transcriptional regulator/GNAT family N-acetyltransferase [Caulobacter endophyticus]|uniref:bifunctional helix-turn-helix transcriptional regulator/GNAT family N-acetyltransferase n=1 Tax=Caulobacter endophyticus TaxID=2172652 RepID=UPI00240EB0B1|nr:bifunctional helix-turn-helix transcriptional regulator/GNAT family N-acetyltransferase [Caulobacter endophyticus]MDG2528855.1 bifunctional helix-turn-helix transcriptional regulator/GNAT family N-acetyltransferase [Caulobacter endophyticus]